MAVWASGVLLFVTVTVHVVAGNCPAGEYGYSCSYQCHCPQVYCNATSGCQPADCSRGWSGPSCQKENIALNRTTSASSIYMASSRAVDGGKGGILSGGSCFHSAYTDFPITSAWWRVDLGQETLVHDVSIYFRTDYIVRRSGIQIYIADTDGSPTDGINCYTVSGTDIPDVLNATCTGEGRYLVLYTTVKSTGDSVPIMDFCEVEVEVCARGTFGADCDNYCHCDGDVCNYVTGVCPSGTCLPGWRTDRCDTACVQGTEYGVGCLKTCSSRMCHGDVSTCPQDTGRCTGGCQAGWKGEDCTTACVQGTEYGVGCLKTCSSRMCHGDVSTCPQDTGRCTGGCQAGWKGEDCTTECVEDVEYGVGCNKNCTTRMCQGAISTCPRETGRCTEGCEAGWKGEDCTTEVSMPLSTGPAVISGVVVAAIAIVAIGVVVVVFLRRRNHRKQSDNHTKIHKEDTDETGVDNPAPVLGEDEDNVEEDHNATYYNIGFAPAVTVVSVDQLGERIKELQVPAGGFQAEYQKLPTIFTRPYTDSQREENKGKNKYISYYPYDATRVVLKELPDQPGSDYINASYIDGYSRPKAYIAAQAPNKKTLTEFWRMIWEQNCTRIVMLTNMKELGRVKCEAYWSDTTDLHVDDFIITVTDSSIRANWVVREVQVTDRQTNTSRCFYHFHFTTWPDHGTPEEMALTEFLWLVRSSYITQDDPLLVHCSAGVGRTGTYIALDYLLDQALAENAVDVLGCVSGIRDQRKGMIQTKEQYTCLYMALYDALQFGNTAITIDEFRNNRNVKGTFSTCRMSITKFIETQNTQREKQSKETSVKDQVWINGRSDILAIRLRSHLSMQGYLLTEAPSVITASLFWKLTEEQESSTVIVLPDSHQCLSSFVPSPGDSLDLGPVTVTCSTEIPVNTNVTLLNTERQMENSEPTHVRVYILNILPAQSPSTFLELLEELDRHTGDVNPNTVTVVYSDGGRQNAAMLCILSNIVQGLKYDKRAEIYNNMRAMVHCLDQDITQDDVALCYDVAAIYLESQNIYANL